MSRSLPRGFPLDPRASVGRRQTQIFLAIAYTQLRNCAGIHGNCRTDEYSSVRRTCGKGTRESSATSSSRVYREEEKRRHIAIEGIFLSGYFIDTAFENLREIDAATNARGCSDTRVESTKRAKGNILPKLIISAIGFFLPLQMVKPLV